MSSMEKNGGSRLREVFRGVFRANGRLCTQNLAPGERAYGEELLAAGGKEYRFWDLYRSKLAGAIQKGLRKLPIKPGSKVLYLGAASGTTASHVSDIAGAEGIVFCVEFSPRTVRDLVKVCEQRGNMIPLLGDARFPEKYAQAIAEEAGGKVDAVYQDVADPEQVRILEINCHEFLNKGGSALLCLKARSIDAMRQPEKIFAETKKRLSQHFEVEEEISLVPYDKDHLFYSLSKK